MIKKFNMTVTLDDCLKFEGHNDGFNIIELIGLLEIKKQDLMNQLHNSENFVKHKRSAVVDGETMIIEEKKDD